MEKEKHWVLLESSGTILVPRTWLRLFGLALFLEFRDAERLACCWLRHDDHQSTQLTQMVQM